MLDGALSCRFLLLCSGYFSYDAGHAPEFPGSGEFNGAFVHPQHWPAELDYRGKRVVVIGSGATAMTLVPAMAEAAAHVTMLQRSPTYVIAFPWRDKFANFLRKVLPMRLAYALTRWKNVTMQMLTYRWARRRPAAAKRIILGRLRKQLGPAIDINAHFTPRYSPWEQRLCLVPDGDLYAALNSGKASVATDAIESFTAGGIKLQSGAELAADIIVSATGIELLMLGGIAFEVDGAAVNFPDAWTYKGMMCSGVPNMLHVYGYINASWTLRADLNAEYFCRLLNHMDAIGARQVTPRLRAQDRDMRARPWIDGFSPGYMRRAMPKFPKQGRAPWVNTQDYWRDRKLLRDGKFDDGALVFSGMAANR